MLVWMLDLFPDALSPAIGKITLRAALAAVVSFTLALLLGSRLIEWLSRRFREPIAGPSETLNRLHRDKQWTPTMGGLFIVAGILSAGALLGDWTNAYFVVCCVLVASLAALGAVDDLAKLRSGRKGVSARTKLTWQCVIAGVVAVLLLRIHADTPQAVDLRLPLLGNLGGMGWWFVPWAMLVIVGASNAVNLTDGLDGLAGGCLLCSTAGIAVLTYTAGHANLAVYLGVPHIPHASETLVLAGGVLGALGGFLWFNCHPAQVFMGDTGSLPLGGLLGLLALIARQEILLVLIGGVFVVEAASVMIQVTVYRWRKRRVFLCAPLHHHFQFRGWPENRIVVRFWIASALCAIIGVAGTKLTLHEPAKPSAARAHVAGDVLAPSP